MLLQCNPKYPRDFHHSSSIKALKCEDLKMQLACLRFQPQRHLVRQRLKTPHRIVFQLHTLPTIIKSTMVIFTPLRTFTTHSANFIFR